MPNSRTDLNEIWDIKKRNFSAVRNINQLSAVFLIWGQESRGAKERRHFIDTRKVRNRRFLHSYNEGATRSQYNSNINKLRYGWGAVRDPQYAAAKYTWHWPVCVYTKWQGTVSVQRRQNESKGTWKRVLIFCICFKHLPSDLF